ncbi:MAG: DEAD/DEAH box helicase family protein, partial [Deltaproteobacteria bacterium]
CRYQQFRAAHRAIYRLRTGKTREETGDIDQRGGIIWHTQGSGKSLTMVFLIRKMRTLEDLKSYKVVVITDRISLEGQLKGSAALTGETIYHADNKRRLEKYLKESASNIVFTMVQKYQERAMDADDEYEIPRPRLLKAAAPSDTRLKKPVLFPVWNTSEKILVLVDEAHRSHTSMLHANLMRALPNCAKIGFTGTPIIAGRVKKKTHEIFGDY